MKKRIISVILMMAMILSVGCKKKAKTESSESSESTTESTTESMTEKTESETDPETTPSTTEKPDPDSFSFTKDNYPVIDGSTSTKPMATAITSVLLGIPREEADSMLEFHKTTRSFSYLMDREAKLLICAEPAQSVFDEMKERKFEYEMEAFSAEALVFVVNASNPVESLTTEQIQKIYTGKIKNWKEVGGEDKEIVAVQRNKTAGSQVMMENLVMGDLQMMTAPEELMPGDMGGLINVVKSYDNSAGAIGYTPYYYATKMKMADGLKILKVDGVMPEKTTIAKGEYPFRTSYFAVIPKDTAEDAPARILFNWILSEEGQKLAEMEGYVPAASASVSKNKVKVHVNWASYQPAEVPDPVYTRLKDELITDFIPSSDYGRIYPFAGAAKMAEWGSASSTKGFFDQSGRIVCDAVYDYVYKISDKTYVVKQYIKGDSEYPEERLGFVSTDGKYYTGVKYYSYISLGNDKYLLAEKTSDGFKVYPFDAASGKTGDPASYKMDFTLEGYYPDMPIQRIIKDRVLVFADTETGNCALAVDGTTGKKVAFPDGIRLEDTMGNLFYGYDENNDSYAHHYYDYTGKEIKLDKVEYISELDRNTLLMKWEDMDDAGWNLTDADGNIVASLEDKGKTIQEFWEKDGKFVALKRTGVEVYDRKLKLISSTSFDHEDQYQIVYGQDDYYSNRFSSKIDKDIILIKQQSEKTYLLDITTGKNAEYDGMYDVTMVPGYVILSTSGGVDHSWMILNCKDLSLLTEGKGYAQIFEDEVTHEYYMSVGEGWDTKTLSIVEVSTGKTVIDDLTNPRGDYLYVDGIYDGKVLYHTVWKVAEYSDGTNSSTTMTDRDGKVLFLYNTVHLPED